MDNVLALGYPQRVSDVTGGRAQHRQQFFAGGMAALIQQVLAKTRLGVERVIERAHQHQHADALTALYPAFFHQLVDGAAQGVAVHLKARRQLLLGGKIVAAAVVLTKLLLKFCGYLLIACWVAGRMCRQVHRYQCLAYQIKCLRNR